MSSVGDFVSLADRVRALQTMCTHVQQQLGTGHWDTELSQSITRVQLCMHQWGVHQQPEWTGTSTSTSASISASPTGPVADAVAQQYKSYPYPRRDPEEEREVMRLHSPGNILELNHYIWHGRCDFTRPLRILVAGAGTGDCVVSLAQHLHDLECPAHIVAVDLSATSLDICKQRLCKRKLVGAVHFPDRPPVPFGSADSSVHVALVVANILDVASLQVVSDGGARHWDSCCLCLCASCDGVRFWIVTTICF